MNRPAPSAPSRSGLLALVLGAVAIGFAPIFVRISEAGPSATAFWRLALALPALLAWSALSSARSAARRPGGRWLPALAGLCFAGDLIIWHQSLRFTTVANSTLLTNLSAVFVPLFAWLVFRQKIAPRFLVALMVALLGTALLAGKNAHLSPQTLRGDALSVLSALFYSGYILSVKAARDRGTGTASIMATSGVIAAAAIFPAALLAGETILPASASGWWTLLALAGVSHLGGQSLIAHALATLPASFASAGLLLQPATATFVAWLWLHESLSAAQLAGALILIAGLWLARPANPRRL